ncbi:hypothetical protein FC093_06060 [Ilyomonas limi]|uniref:PNPLA domain-containing protein n=1 Tax=Ilyomonas limi TaxID=2575867 RepID=A0A4U3L8R5_9BACT|nr:hypothetical protein [Ilyomonas limi]TKK70306.1 hypothetical protein FC093_06060 [Ilyomonas limi]
MKRYITGFYFSLPVQLFLLHFRRYQVLLIFWYVLFATVDGNFLQPYGADTLYLAPEYWGSVNTSSMTLTGFAIGIFVMSWNITTFILHTKHIRFLATTAQPFLKFCINNAVIPLAFLIFYFIKAIKYDAYEELIPAGRIVVLMSSFLAGFIIAIFIAFGYFFGADKNIYRRLRATITKANEQYSTAILQNPLPLYRGEIRVLWFFSASLGLRKPRDVRHYSEEFLNTIFKQHHLAAVLAVLLAFIFLVSVGYLSDSTIFQIPAAASITIFFAILIGVAGAFSLFLKSWSIPVIILLYLIINALNDSGVIDLRNRAYGINYNKNLPAPAYTKEAIEAMASPANMEADKQAFLQTLNAWKARQKEDKPVMFLIDVSGGGNRSAAFTMNVLQRLDSVTHGTLMQHTMLISGASGGMLGATYFRGLYFEKVKGSNINLQNHQYAENISRDLLNPLFSSFITRDIMGPAATFNAYGYEYVKDRAYAFEQKFNHNTKGVLNKRLADYRDAEMQAQIPTIIFNSTISRDGRKMIVSTRPLRFLMQAYFDTTKVSAKEIDGVDFVSFFKDRNPLNLGVLSALRMNATFPYVLPSVWLPSDPVIDVLDAGLRDNFGQETSFRFVSVFKDWLEQNTSKVIVLQIRDRQSGDWDRPFENNSLSGFITKPLMLMQSNWFRIQTYYQLGQLDYLSESMGQHFYRFSFQYIPSKKDASASLSFHLTASEKKDIAASLNSSINTDTFNEIKRLMENK